MGLWLMLDTAFMGPTGCQAWLLGHGLNLLSGVAKRPYRPFSHCQSNIVVNFVIELGQLDALQARY